jgi:hypothetical protein
MQARRGWKTTATVAVVLAMLALLAPLAQAAAPANDNFANRETLNSSLPIDVSRSNVDATKESGEALQGLAPAGHSVWFEWEAMSTEWVTIGACDSDFPELLGVYTGTAVNSLTKVTNGNASEGPNCLFQQREYTFKATSGTKYEIAVDGNAFFVETPPPTTEGSFGLQIEATPPPANDDFVDAAKVVGSVSEEPNGARFFFASLNGYNWNATEETGEPDHAGDPGGASVWYRWTAPESGTAQISTCCGSPRLLAVYSGTALGSLTPLGSVSGFGGGVNLAVSAGTAYQIAVDGPEDGSSGEAAMGSFSLHVSMALAPGPGEAKGGSGSPQPPKDVTAPETTILKRTIKPGKRQATFNFTSSEAGGGFRCKLDARALAACNPPKTYSGLAPGKHVFRVAAVDSAGNTDASSAVARFAIPKPKARHRSSR